MIAMNESLLELERKIYSVYALCSKGGFVSVRCSPMAFLYFTLCCVRLAGGAVPVWSADFSERLGAKVYGWGPGVVLFRTAGETTFFDYRQVPVIEKTSGAGDLR